MVNISRDFNIDSAAIVEDSAEDSLKHTIDNFERKYITYGKPYSQRILNSLNRAAQKGLPELNEFDQLATFLVKNAERISVEGISLGKMQGPNVVLSILSGMDFDAKSGKLDSPSDKILDKILLHFDEKIKNVLGEDLFSILYHMKKLKTIFNLTFLIKITLLISNIQRINKDTNKEPLMTLEEFSEKMKKIYISLQGDITLNTIPLYNNVLDHVSDDFSKVFNMLTIIYIKFRASVISTGNYDPTTYENMKELLHFNKSI